MAVAVVVQLSAPVREAGVSPFTKVVYVAVNVGFGAPNARVALLAVMVERHGRDAHGTRDVGEGVVRIYRAGAGGWIRSHRTALDCRGRTHQRAETRSCVGGTRPSTLGVMAGIAEP